MTGGKYQVKIQWKRNAVVATVLLFVCAAVYLNWRYAGNVVEDVSIKRPIYLRRKNTRECVS